MKRFCFPLTVVFLLLILATACGRAAEEPEAGVGANGEVSPLTREQIQEHAEAMSPEVAESLGIVDTTIRIEPPIPAESVRGVPPPADSIPPSL